MLGSKKLQQEAGCGAWEQAGNKLEWMQPHYEQNARIHFLLLFLHILTFTVRSSELDTMSEPDLLRAQHLTINPHDPWTPAIPCLWMSPTTGEKWERRERVITNFRAVNDKVHTPPQYIHTLSMADIPWTQMCMCNYIFGGSDSMQKMTWVAVIYVLVSVHILDNKISSAKSHYSVLYA